MPDAVTMERDLGDVAKPGEDRWELGTRNTPNPRCLAQHTSPAEDAAVEGTHRLG